jgi:hypothetical protein
MNGSMWSAASDLPQAERVAVAEIQDTPCSHPQVESDAREEKKSYKLQAAGRVPA